MEIIKVWGLNYKIQKPDPNQSPDFSDSFEAYQIHEKSKQIDKIDLKIHYKYNRRV